jgi:hypothetical protein
MKNLLITLALVLSTVRLVAQTADNQHLMFKGVPIDGTLSEYVEKMKLNGFTLLGSENNGAIFTGEFANYQNCKIGVGTSNKKDLVSTVFVMFPEREEWNDLYGDYNRLKQMLSEKYGIPNESKEKWENDYEPSLAFRMSAIKRGECNFTTIFVTPNGKIQLRIEHQDATCFVFLGYFDKINGEIMKAKAIDDL